VDGATKGNLWHVASGVIFNSYRDDYTGALQLTWKFVMLYMRSCMLPFLLWKSRAKKSFQKYG